jgi:SAM-dependent methyltransferase
MPPAEITKLSYKLDLKMKIIKEYGFELNPSSRILDFGCGSGRSVQELMENGYQAYGCDINFKHEEDFDSDSLVKNGILRPIDINNYILPFEDNFFDVIISDEVFEHVKNYNEAIGEISRVLKPDGCCLSIFPSRYNPIEVHVFVPFSSVIQSYWWLYLWVLLGIHNEWEDCRTTKERSTRFYNYLKEKTNYLSKKQLTENFRTHFKNVIFCEKTFLKYSRRGKYISALTEILPFIASIYSTFRSRVIITWFPGKSLI